MFNEQCPECGHEMEGYENQEELTRLLDCDNCGWCDPKEYYESPDGTLVLCTEERARELGLLFDCECGNLINYWEHEEQGRCVECWHRQNMLDKGQDNVV